MKIRASLFKLLCVAIAIVRSETPNRTFKCGVRPSKRNFLIVGGKNTSPNRWPWHVKILHWSKDSKSWEYRCGGTLINTFQIVTAKHCLSEIVSLKSSNLAIEIDGKQFVVQDYETPWQEPRYEDWKNDIGIIELRSEVELSDRILPACLPEQDVITGENGTVVGYGFTESGSVSPTLKIARMSVIGPFACIKSDPQNFGSGFLDDGYFCAGKRNGTTVCNGDSGGGLVFWRNGTWQVGGIVSFAPSRDGNRSLCKTDGYAAYTNVYAYKEWIKEKMNRVPLGSLLPRNCGRQTSKSNMPWIVAIYAEVAYNSSFERTLHHEFRGLGTLISRRYVLTPVTEHADRYRVLLKPETVHSVMDELKLTENIHCMAAEYLWALGYSVSLLFLKNTVFFDDYIQPACIPLTTDPRAPIPEQFVLIFRDDNNKIASRVISKAGNPDCFGRKRKALLTCCRQVGCPVEKPQFLAFNVENGERHVLYGAYKIDEGSSDGTMFNIFKVLNSLYRDMGRHFRRIE